MVVSFRVLRLSTNQSNLKPIDVKNRILWFLQLGQNHLDCVIALYTQ